MTERIFELTGADPAQLYGPSNTFLKQIGTYFPKLKIVARGHKIKVSGPEEIVLEFEDKLDGILAYVEKHKTLDQRAFDNLVQASDAAKENYTLLKDEVILHGPSGRIIKAKTPNQYKLIESSIDNDMVFAIGPAGTGKTYTAVALAVRALKNREVRRIILTRPAVEAGENLGFLPGDLKEKLDPYLAPLYDALRDMIPKEKLEFYLENKTIEIAPLAFMRGRTLDDAFVILDESQNTTTSQMKMFLTRMGESARFIITGDTSQIDLPKHQKSGLKEAISYLSDVKGIGFVYLDGRDVIRHPLVKQIIKAYEQKD
ncbi:MAG: PhoH family protein [Schleiferiaceae bacterium]|nr:PhoH family protein [Schleiferiaceae bacterium]MDP4759824.1 PhoH family protein [Schleiferiaceae bacterium]MDP4768363.1 PhoH family protein [Schleiferiaceae bacterium]MDP4877281.1 PhoH family protein [Schleiferiaceae bacterium]MDP4959786.1 PhoH family protein [Schleiferiaceae bacterium]